MTLVMNRLVAITSVLVLRCALPVAAQLDQNCTVSILNRTAQVGPDGDWIIRNIPSNIGKCAPG